MKKSKIFAIAAVVFLVSGIVLMNNARGITETPELNPYDGITTIFVLFILTGIFALIHAKKNL